MFSKKVHPDVKKSTAKFLDLKKDTSTRLKHLRIVIGEFSSLVSSGFQLDFCFSDNAEGEELSEFFNTHNKQIYYLVRECITAAENNFKQRGKLQ